MPTQEKVTRKLRAILSADVMGYSLLMADDEAYTVRKLEEYRTLMSNLIEANSGRVVDAVGDNLLAEFSSAVDAVQCAVEIQKALKSKNSELAKDKQLNFRIGVNVGDVIQDKDRIYGAGVNVAARIESLADPGGICISRNAYDHIKDKLNFGYEYLGDHEVKNIKDPVRVYKVSINPEDAGKLIGERKKRPKLKWLLAVTAIFSILTVVILGGLYWKYLYLPAPENIDPENKMTFELPKGPSIAVLPLDNMTGDPEQEFLCDGITENIISSLSYIPNLFVIARNSTFAYKGKSITAQQVGRELGAQYLLEGSIQKSIDRIRITVQLIETSTGHHKLSEIYDRKLGDIFKLQDEIALKIMKATETKLTGGKQLRTRFEGIDDLQVVIKILKALEYFYWFSIEGNNLSRKELFDIIDLNPNISFVYTLLAATYMIDLGYGACKSNIICFGQATDATRKAISLDENNSDAHLCAGGLFAMKKDLENGIASLKHSIRLNPNNADAYAFLGWVLAMSDQPSEGIKYIKNAFLLNPSPPSFYLSNLGICYRILKQYDDAITAFKKSIQIQPGNLSAHIGLIFTYNLSGQEDKAYKLGLEVLKLNPNFSAEKYVNASPFSSSEDKYMLFTEALRKAGLPD
ncbi:adenylate/guanylate cyclase domain-containing protein [Thermodesulfobacteriota bacterium]